MKKKTPAQKAAATTQARTAFRNCYGKLAYNVVRMICTNKSDLTIRNHIWHNSDCWDAASTLAAFKANLNRRGTYRTMALACSF